MDITKLRNTIDKADLAYYRTGCEPIMSDVEYDNLRSQLRELCPNDPRLTRVGTPYSADEIGTKVNHTIPMGSLDNTDDGIVGFQPWYESISQKIGCNPDILMSTKIDGSSIAATYRSGKLVLVATRGNGEIGEDVTANGARFRHLPMTLTEEIDAEVRGEAILYKHDFVAICDRDNIPQEERSNPRNVGNGIIGREDGTDSDLITYLAFNIFTGRKYATQLEKFEHLNKLGFKPVPHKLCESPKHVQDFYNVLASGRDDLPFEIDGAVVVCNSIAHQEMFITKDVKSVLRPKYARAIKFPHKSNITKLLNIVTTVGHTGAIIPTAVLQEVRIGGVNVSNALLNNWDEIKRLDVAYNDDVEVVLAGDIIPKIIRVVNKSPDRTPIDEPKYCPGCGDVTTRERHGKKGAVTYCSNKKCPEAMFQKVDHWIGSSKKGVGILGIGDTMLRAIWTEGIISDPADLYTVTVEQIENVVLNGGMRIGRARAEQIVQNIRSKRCIPLATFLGSLGIDLLGRRRVKLLAEASGGKLTTLADWMDIEKLRTITIDGLGDTIRESIVDGISDNLDLIKKFLANGVTIQGESEGKMNENTNVVPSSVVNDQPSEVSGKPFAGLSFCFTGTRDGVEDVERLGGTIKSGVSKGLTYLVQKDALSVSNKTKKADEYGVKIISIDYLKKAVAGEAKL